MIQSNKETLEKIDSAMDGVLFQDDRSPVILIVSKALQEKDTLIKKILDEMPCERIEFESECSHSCEDDLVCEDFTEEQYYYGINEHVSIIQAYKDKIKEQL